jgi:uncharacterized protein
MRNATYQRTTVWIQVRRRRLNLLNAKPPSRLLNWLLCFVLAYTFFLVVVRVFERRLMFFPDFPGRLQGDWHPAALAPEDVWLTASDSTKLHGWWISNPSAKFTFLAFHGNASNIANRAPTYEFLRDTPANVFALEYRGYGRSEGEPSEAGLYLDADAAYEYLVSTRGIDPKAIISFGQSLGTAVATHLAAHRAVAGVVLEAPFPSPSRVAQKSYWFLPGLSLLVRGQFNTESNLKRVTAPILIVHCSDDPVISLQFGQEVYASARSPKYFFQIEGACHEESSSVAPVQYRSTLRRFLRSLTGR